ncbi:hypothetical protein [Aliamphritea spongicola]|nr:hypothetical protein [Aliamphritea spongicola]
MQKKQAVIENVDGVSYCWIKTRAYKGNGLARVLNMLQFAISLLFLNPVCRFNFDKPKHIIVSSAHPFHFLAGWLYSKRYGSTLSFEIRDIWPLSLTNLLGLSPYHPFCLLLKFLN